MLSQQEVYTDFESKKEQMPPNKVINTDFLTIIKRMVAEHPNDDILGHLLRQFINTYYK